MVLKDSDLDKWAYKQSTEVKHRLLVKYLQPWIQKLGSHNRRICCFDVFAGRGEYKEGALGSPLLILKRAIELKKGCKEIICYYIEKDKENYEFLKKLIEKETIPDNIKVYVECGPFDKIVSKGLDKIKDKLAPSFFFIDPFGFKGVPFKIIKRLLSIPKVEIFLNFMYYDINRFLDVPTHTPILDDFFGTEEWKKIRDTYKDISKEFPLRDLYLNQLHKETGAKYTISYKINTPEMRRTRYYLIHATNHFDGFKIMKDIMYNEGTKGIFAYLGPDEAPSGYQQRSLLDYGLGLNDFENYLIKKFKNKELSFYDIMEQSYTEVSFIETHYRSALKKLENEKKIQMEGKGPKGGIPYTTTIRFL